MPQYIGSSALLANNATYTSRWVNSDIFANICGSAFSDQAGTLFVEQSGDGVNVDISKSVTVTASTGASYNEVLVLPFVRLRLTNSGGATQTVLRLYSRFILGNMP